MTRSRSMIVAAAVVCVACLAWMTWARTAEAPPVAEFVEWITLDELGEPPYDGPVLIEFHADWCVPCRRLQITTYRDRDFAEELERRGITPVRVRFESVGQVEFTAIQKRFGVKPNLPGFALLDRKGTVVRDFYGWEDTQQFRWHFERAERSTRLKWNRAPKVLIDRDSEFDAERPTVLYFGQPYFLPGRIRHDWRQEPTPEFRDWTQQWFNMNLADRKSRARTVEMYRTYSIEDTPTLILLDDKGNEIERFVGSTEVSRSPKRLAELAREHGFEVPPPPQKTSSRFD